MNKNKKFALALISIAIILYGVIGFAKPVEAADALPPGYLVGDDTGLKVGTDGQYFIRHDDIKPGLTFERTITISNYYAKQDSFDVKFVMNPEDADHKPTTSGEVDLMTAVSVTLEYQGKTIYQGTIDGAGTPIANKKSNPINLGEFETGEVRAIKATFKVSDAYPESAWKKANSADFYWLFFVSRKDTEDSSTTDSSSTKNSTDKSDTTDTTSSKASDTSGGSGGSGGGSGTGTRDSNGSGTTTDTTGNTTDTTGGTTGTSDSDSIIKQLLGKLPQTGEDWMNALLGIVVGGIIVCVVLIIGKKRKQDK